MAATAGTETVNLIINDIPLAVPKGELIVESVKRLGLEIPIFCYHPRLKPVGMCRMCLVEVGFKQPDGSVRMMPKPQAGCSLPASEGMVIYTDTESVHKDRKGVLEFLLINHPLDCPICDRGGECPLQNNTLFYGPSTSRYIEMKRHLPKAYPLSKYVTLDLERCIQCGRCVRFTEEISGDSQLAFRFRGSKMQPSTFQLMDFTSKFSGNVIEICPVGALTSTEYRFRARPWDIETKPSVCTVCSNGCNVWFDHRAGKFVRINGRTNEAINEEWTCDRGKFGHGFYNSEKRLQSPLIRKGDQFAQATWAEAYEAILKAFEPGGNKVAGIAGHSLSNESLYMFQKLFRGTFKSNNIDHRFTKLLPEAGDNPIQSTIESFESKKTILVLSCALEDELPILFLRVRKAWSRLGTKVVLITDGPTEVENFADLVIKYKPGTQGEVIQGLAALLENGKSAAGKSSGVSAEQMKQVSELLAEGLSAIITSRNIYNEQGAYETIANLKVIASKTESDLNIYALGANEQGADDLGVLPTMLPGYALISSDQARAEYAKKSGFDVPEEAGLGTHGILEGCKNGSIKALWLAGVDPFSLHPDGDLVKQALENVDFLVCQDVIETESMGFASVVLPLEAPAEQDGTYTNMERRVQRIRPIVPAPGDAKQGWRTFMEATVRAVPGAPLFNAEEVMEEIIEVLPLYRNARYSELLEEGSLIGNQSAEEAKL